MLTTEGFPMSRYVASKRMKELALVSCQLPLHRYKKTGNEHLAIPNTLNREFAADYPNQIWCGDVTYVWTGKRWSYLAVVLDLYAGFICIKVRNPPQYFSNRLDISG